MRVYVLHFNGTATFLSLFLLFLFFECCCKCLYSSRLGTQKLWISLVSVQYDVEYEFYLYRFIWSMVQIFCFSFMYTFFCHLIRAHLSSPQFEMCHYQYHCILMHLYLLLCYVFFEQGFVMNKVGHTRKWNQTQLLYSSVVLHVFHSNFNMHAYAYHSYKSIGISAITLMKLNFSSKFSIQKNVTFYLFCSLLFTLFSLLHTHTQMHIHLPSKYEYSYCVNTYYILTSLYIHDDNKPMKLLFFCTYQAIKQIKKKVTISL